MGSGYLAKALPDPIIQLYTNDKSSFTNRESAREKRWCLFPIREKCSCKIHSQLYSCAIVACSRLLVGQARILVRVQEQQFLYGKRGACGTYVRAVTACAVGRQPNGVLREALASLAFRQLANRAHSLYVASVHISAGTTSSAESQTVRAASIVSRRSTRANVALEYLRAR